MKRSLALLINAYRSEAILCEHLSVLRLQISAFKRINSSDNEKLEFQQNLARSLEILTQQLERLQCVIDKEEKTKSFYTLYLLEALARRALNPRATNTPKLIRDVYKSLDEKIKRLLIAVQALSLFHLLKCKHKRPPLALGYDINTLPAAPPYAFNLVYYSLKTDLEGIYYERFKTSRS